MIARGSTIACSVIGTRTRAVLRSALGCRRTATPIRTAAPATTAAIVRSGNWAPSQAGTYHRGMSVLDTFLPGGADCPDPGKGARDGGAVPQPLQHRDARDRVGRLGERKSGDDRRACSDDGRDDREPATAADHPDQESAPDGEEHQLQQRSGAGRKHDRSTRPGRDCTHQRPPVVGCGSRS